MVSQFYFGSLIFCYIFDFFVNLSFSFFSCYWYALLLYFLVNFLKKFDDRKFNVKPLMMSDGFFESLNLPTNFFVFTCRSHISYRKDLTYKRLTKGILCVYYVCLSAKGILQKHTYIRISETEIYIYQI